MVDKPPTLEEGVAVREELRTVRAVNYAVKRGHEFACAVDGCEVRNSILVVRDEDGLTTRCPLHIGDLDPTPGQWNEHREAE